ncbi:MAG: acyltransferase [Clostridia bacterium]|nr:acyltransferase [Clostridia bacterium]
MSKRFEELDSLRGIAAMTVVFCHFLAILPGIESGTYQAGSEWIMNLIKYTPLHIFWGGYEAVIFFFVLSGFVLSLPFYKGSAIAYTPFFVKRVCRIYIPYIVAVAIAIIMDSVFSRGGIEGLSEWFNSKWITPVSGGILFDHAILIGDFKNGVFNPVLWSLVHEMRISILFPIIMLFIVRFSWRASIGLGILLTFIGVAGNAFLRKYTDYEVDYFYTLIYTFMFIIGALLAKHREYLIERYRAFSKPIKLVLLTLAVMAYTYKWWCLKDISIIHKSYFENIIISVGTVIFVLSALSSGVISKILLFRPVHFIGKTSYSIYLYHAIALLTFTNLLYETIPVWAIWLTSLAVTFIVSTLMYQLIELPSMKLGKYVSQRILPTRKRTADNLDSAVT